VSVSVLPSLATRWMVPRLGRFLDAHPGIDVRISPTRHLADFTSEAIDLGIRYGGGRYPGLVVEKLADDELVVAAAPSLLARQRLAEPADLRRHKLLHDDSPDEWRRWLAAHGAHDVDASRGPVFNDASMLLEAAVRGQGVALARRSLAMDELGAGRLVLPLPRIRPMRTGLAYYVACPRENLARPAVAAFVRWLRAEAAGLRAKG
jgi:LysR family transcriptional regulator, glycine cleavage system transcriptional activator